MKLNYKRTCLVGMAFFLITAFWQAYDAIVPLILTNHFGLPQGVSGAVMSLDNVLAVFLLPLFGALSDRVKTPWGKRTPFVALGTVAAVVAFVGLIFVDNYQLARVIAAGVPQAQGDRALELAWQLTAANPLPLVGFLLTLLVVLVAMATFRSPAVALMPDITPKPLRSKGNAIINLCGAVGGVLVLVLGMVFATSKNHYMYYTGYVLSVCALMVLALAVFLLTVKENRWAMAQEEPDAASETAGEAPATAGGLSRAQRRSFLLILASVALWYVGYNSITSKYSVYATNVLGFDFNLTLIVAQAAAIVSYVPVGFLASRLGRRKTVLLGVAMLAGAFLLGIPVTGNTPEAVMYPVFVLAGVGWATINVNSFPMAVELAKGSNVGKYTGYYYTASMSAQIVAPVLSGFLYDLWGMERVFFPFGAVFVILSFVTMFFVRHGDSTPQRPQSALEQLGAEE